MAHHEPHVSYARSAAAGVIAALAWGALEPIDRRVFKVDYEDVAVLGKLVTRDRWWRPAGFVMHAANGAIFGLTYEFLRRRLGVRNPLFGVAMAMAEHVALWFLWPLVDRVHPASGQSGVPRGIVTNRRAFSQEATRHALFGVVLSLLTRTAKR